MFLDSIGHDPHDGHDKYWWAIRRAIDSRPWKWLFVSFVERFPLVLSIDVFVV